MASPATIAQMAHRWYAAQAGGGGTSAPQEFESFLNVGHFRPYVWDADDQFTTGEKMFNATATHPPVGNNPPDPPWYDTNVLVSPQVTAICWVGGNMKKCYVVVATTDPAPSQDLWECDEFFSTATLLQSGWMSNPASASTAYRCYNLCHYASADFEGLAAWSVSATATGRRLATFNFSGVAAGPLNSGYTYFPTGNQNSLLYLTRGDSTSADNRGLFATELRHNASGAGTARYLIVALPALLLADTGQQDYEVYPFTQFEQLCFDFEATRILFPEITLNRTVTDGLVSWTFVSSKIRQITQDIPGSWSATTTSDLIACPTDTYEFPGAGETYPELWPHAVWTNGIDGGIYVWYVGRLPSLTVSGLGGIVRYDSAGLNPVVVHDKGFVSNRFIGPKPGDFVSGGQVVLGPGCRAPWEL